MAGTALLRRIHARAPLRINDIGGWTDTWFAGDGCVLNAAAGPPVEVQVDLHPHDPAEPVRVVVQAENYGETFSLDPDRPGPRPHPLLQQAIGLFPVRPDRRLDISIHSPVPAGISTGTSASVCVALLGALSGLAGGPPAPAEIAALAHAVETEKLKQQSGIQDQLCAAHGGVCFIRMPAYPRAEVERLDLAAPVREELERRLLLVYLGRPHDSSAIHEQVIALLEAERTGPRRAALDALKRLAAEARDALAAGSLEAYGDCMVRNNERQRELLEMLVSPEADAVAAVAARHGASGWKVNGAGGRGGSITVLAGPDDPARRRLIEAVGSLGGGIRILPVRLSMTGLAVWDA